MTEEENSACKIEPKYLIKKGNITRSHQGDLFCEKGIAALQITEPLMIEIKGGLLISIVGREIQKGQDYLKENPGHHYWIIYGNTNVDVPDDNIGGVNLYSFSTIIERGGNSKNESIITEDTFLDQELVIKKAVNSLHDNNCTFILGAGVSVEAGSPSWDNLLKGLIGLSPDLAPIGNGDYGNVNSKCSWSSLITARYILDNKVAARDIIERMRTLIYTRKERDYIKEPTSLPFIAKVVSDCNIESCITFNYDEFLEEALKVRNVKFTPFYDKGAIVQGELPIYHVHGLIARNSESASSYPVLSEREYHLLYANDFHWSNVEILRSLIRNTCFLVGLSMSDPNLRRLLDIARYDDNGDARHFVFMRKEPLDCNNSDASKDIKHWETMERKYFELGLNIIWYDYNPNDPADFTDLAKKIESIHSAYISQYNLHNRHL